MAVPSLSQLRSDLYPIALEFVRLLERYGVEVHVTSVYRGSSHQAGLYERYLAGEAAFPAAPPGHSTHACRIAWDMELHPAVYLEAGRIWEAMGFRWGGRFDDPIHFDFFPTGYTVDKSRPICAQLGRFRG